MKFRIERSDQFSLTQRVRDYFGELFTGLRGPEFRELLEKDPMIVWIVPVSISIGLVLGLIAAIVYRST